MKLNALSGQLFNLLSQGHLFGADTKQVKATQKKLEAEIVKLEAELDDIKNNALYRNAFEWRFEFPEVLNNNGTFEGFDVIIGNPPYIQLQKLNETLNAALELQQYQTFGKTGDIYQLFYERGLALLKPKGHLAFITSNKWMRTDYGGPTRNLLATGCRTLFVVDFGMAQLFESATTYTNILVASNAEATGTITMCRIKNDYHIKTPLEQYVAANAVTMATPTKTECWIPYDKTEFDIISKITSKGIPLREWAININRGVLTGFNEAFIIDTDTRDRLVAEDPNCASIIRPILRGEDVKAYVPHFNGIYLINSHNGIKKTDLPSVDVEGDYPSVFAWLSKFKEKLVKRYDQGDHWTNLRNCAYLEEFSKPKIIYPNMTKFLPFAYDESEGYVCNDKAFIITGEHLKYLTGILNSTLWKFAFKERFPELLGDTREVRKVFFDKIPIIKPYGDFEEKIAGKVVEIVAAKKNGKSTAKLEREMDKLVFRLYALDYDEVKIIEPEFALTRWEYEK